MTEIPEHLRQRTRSRRQALGLPTSGDEPAGAGGAGAGTPATAPAAGGGAPATPANVPKGPVAPSGPVERAAPAPPPPAPYVEAYQRRRKIPVWAMPVVVALPLWAFLYAGTLEPPPVLEPGLLEHGAQVYTGPAGCAACHGGGGGGGVGPGFTGIGEVFPNPVDMVRWIILGSSGGAEVYQAAGKQVRGGMPAFGPTLSLREIVEVTLHERHTLGGHPIEDDAEGWADLRQLPDEFPDLGYTEAEVDEILAELADEEGITIPEE